LIFAAHPASVTWLLSSSGRWTSHSDDDPDPANPTSPVRKNLTQFRLITGGDLLAPQHDSAVRFAEALTRMIQLAPDPVAVGTLSPSPAWVGWDHAADELWPAPDDREGDLNVVSRHRWLDEIGAAVRRQLRALDRPAVIGHGDWYSQNLRWVDRRLHAVHDWDSVVAPPEAAIVGQAAAVWPGTGLPGEVATVQQS
jgi:hypothetical protein